jgi:hypothetical protein
MFVNGYSNCGRCLLFAAEDVTVSWLAFEHCHRSQGEAFVLAVPELG